MLRTERSIDIACPVAEVFDFVADPTNDPKWHTTVLEARKLGDGPTRLGSRFAIRHDGGGEGVAEIVAFDPPRSLTTEARFDRPGALFHWLAGSPLLSFVTEPREAGTRLTRRVEFRPSGPFRVIALFMQGSTDRRNEELLRSIKQLLEAS